MGKSAPVLAIIGGGRWGQLHLSVVAKMRVPFDRIVIVSKANAIEVRDKITELNLTSPISFEIQSTIDDLFAAFDVKAAVVVNAAGQHFETARQLINRGVHVLIEKPIVHSIKQMQILIEEAQHHHVCLVPGLSYRFCSYLQNFSFEVSKKGNPKQFFLNWCDAVNERRYGQVKKHDASISVVQDVMPHVWTILSRVFRTPKIKILAGTQDNNSAVLDVMVNDIEGQVLLQRNGVRRERFLSLQYDSDRLSLDFAREPGVMFVGSLECCADPLWGQVCSPLTLQLEYFFSVIMNGHIMLEDLQCCLESVNCTELASAVKSKRAS